MSQYDEQGDLHQEVRRLRREVIGLREDNARLVEELSEVKALNLNVLEHGTFLENVLDERVRHATLQALTDPLTGIHNRLKLQQTLEIEVARKHRSTGELSVIMFDIDHFKRINDRHGHMIGDRVLVGIIQLVNELIRESDVFARWGGEEFMVLTTTADLDGNMRFAERMWEEIAKASFDPVGTVTCSFGVAIFADDESVGEFLKRADAALYEAKDRGRNRVVSG